MFGQFEQHKLTFLLFLCFFFDLGVAITQDHVYLFNHLTSDHGLTSGKSNYYIHQDSEGFVWISSTTGLNRFDGKRIKQYHTNLQDPHALKSEFAAQSKFFEAKNGDLWFTNNVCLTRYNRKQDNFDHYQFVKPNKDTARNLYFWTYLDPETGTLFTSGDRQLFSLNINHPEERFWVDSVFAGLKDRMFKAPGGGYYLLRCGYGNDTLEVRQYRNNQLHNPVRYYTPPDGAGINDMIYVSDELVWVVTSRGVKKLNMTSGQWQNMPTAYKDDIVDDVVEIARLDQGNLVVGTQQKGIYFFDPVRNQYVGKIKTFKNDLIVPFEPILIRMKVDAQQNLWLYAEDDGVYFTNLKKPKFKLNLAGEGNGVNSIKSLYEGKNGIIWALLPKEVLKITPTETIPYLLPISGADLQQTTSIFEDSQGRVWVGTLSELFLKQPNSKGFEAVDLLPPGYLQSVPGYNHFAELPSGDILVATNRLYPLQVTADLDSSFWLTKNLTRPNLFVKGPNNQFLIYTYQDSLFLGHLSKNGQYKIDTTVQGLPFISTICHDKNRDFYWIATFNGLYQLYYKNKIWHLIQEKNIKANTIINSLLLADDDQLWMAIPGGLMRYHPETHQQNFYKKADGLQGPDYNNKAALKHSDGRFFFGGTNGLTIFRPEEIFSTVPPARPAIVAIKINQEEGVAQLYSPDGEGNPMHIQQLRLPYNKNNISLFIASLEYSDPAACRFRYQLLGSTDTSVVDIGTNPQIDFLNLSPGRYTLHIWASNSDGVWSEQPRRLKIEILPPWYQTWCFFGLLVLLLAGLFYGLYRYRLREILQHQTLEKAASEAKQLAAETETAVLRLQMNPHFIFNSLNSIDAYILGGDKQTAHDYLIRFADLMRGILNSSEKTMNSIDDEIELLTKYLDTEQMRIGARMSYSFVVAPEVDTYETEIPTMILQPFVENAIWHGISPKTGPGHIRISFRIEGGELICEVTDDGVGRKASSGAVKKHESKALSITHRRLALLGNEAARRKSSCTIHDDMDDAGLPAGTTVRLHFPIA